MKVLDREFKIGDRNIEAALALLSENNINIEHKDIGGKSGRTIYHYSETGTTIVKMHVEFENHPDDISTPELRQDA